MIPSWANHYTSQVVLGQGYFLERIKHQGLAPFNPGGAGYNVFINVKRFGAKGDGVTDDTVAINAAIRQGARCVAGPANNGGCASSTTSPAIVYFPAGTYGAALVDADPYDSEVQDYGSTNVFYRQVRNLIIDTTSIPANQGATGLHWPTAQATSLQNVVFKMAEGAASQHTGVFIENGSGGFMTDLVFYGGKTGMTVGSQQFTTRNLTFFNHISNTPIAFKHARTADSSPKTGGSLVLENVLLTNVAVAVQQPTAQLDGNQLITSFVSGHAYDSKGPAILPNPTRPYNRPGSLLHGAGNYYTRSKPQYDTVPTLQFVSVRDAGAKGDAVTDDSAVLQSVIDSATAAGKIVFFDNGMYKVTKTIKIPAGAKIVGEAYPVILASGAFFQNMQAPVPVVQVGAAGESGHVEWSDMVISSQGPCAGAILIQWNLSSPPNAPSGMWDVHTRIGGMEITPSASGLYMENVWLWSADHDIEEVKNRQITVYSGRGLSISSTVGNIWLIGTSVEHHVFYQYQLTNTQNIFMGFIQTESPYYQPVSFAPTPFTTIAEQNDPDFGVYCKDKDVTCNEAWGARIVNSKNIMIYGAGFYQFFNNYRTKCTEHSGNGVYSANCQTQIFGIDTGGPTPTSGSSVYVYALNTVGVVSMIEFQGNSIAKQEDNTNGYAETIIMFST
ncbi:putative Glucan 1,3-beta-glucosidase [Glarea lozoyensis 74030]|uniref:Putative Glucan 1,3-beta-glucosidase n=1 Tax=Glarea lozoyensis (strain ATCC 74030 / MF5533) TaxID=1104152 RepID=H0EGA5_GLAL7|nr:putative Glucan 1,3-beta-glucosidase [Glarea lozoyensis 74030]